MSDLSLSARRAWIEIDFVWRFRCYFNVALRKESVDRNFFPVINLLSRFVALRKESVDRNATLKFVNPYKLVALRKESVDRNPPMCTIRQMPLSRSPQGERG